MYWPASTSYDRAVAVSTRRSSTGSASGGGSRGSRGCRGAVRLTSITRSEGGLCSSTPIRPSGAATTQVRRCCAVNSACVPACDHSPNRPHRARLLRVEPSRRQRADDRGGFRLRQPAAVAPGWAGCAWWPGAPGRASARSTVAAVSGAVPSAPKSSRPSVSTVSSPRCRPSVSVTVSTSPGSSSTAVTAPGRTRYRSSDGSAGSSPGRIRRGRSADSVMVRSPAYWLLGLVPGSPGRAASSARARLPLASSFPLASTFALGSSVPFA
jgi:hypothetical protein